MKFMDICAGTLPGKSRYTPFSVLLNSCGTEFGFSGPLGFLKGASMKVKIKMEYSNTMYANKLFSLR